MIRKYGFKKSSPRATDMKYTAHRVFSAGEPLPEAFDLRSKCPEVYDQGQIGSCTANAGCFAFQFDEKQQNANYGTPSRLFLYYTERSMDGDVQYDAGSTLRTCIAAIS